MVNAAEGTATLIENSTAQDAKKRCSEDSDNDNDNVVEKKAKTEEEGQMIDIPKLLNITSNCRIEVQWNVGSGDDAMTTCWWGANLLLSDTSRQHTLHDDDETPVNIAVYTLDYDANPSAGFPDRSLEQVAFLTDHSLLLMNDEDNNENRAHWRLEGSTWEPEEDAEEEILVPGASREEALRTILDSVLQTALSKSPAIASSLSGGGGPLSASQSRLVAEKIGNAKEKLLQKLLEQLDNDDNNNNNSGDDHGMVVTPEHVRRCMEEIGKEIEQNY